MACHLEEVNKKTSFFGNNQHGKVSCLDRQLIMVNSFEIGTHLRECIICSRVPPGQGLSPLISVSGFILLYCLLHQSSVTMSQIRGHASAGNQFNALISNASQPPRDSNLLWLLCKSYKTYSKCFPFLVRACRVQLFQFRKIGRLHKT